MLYLIGAPGSGKTTLLRRALAPTPYRLRLRSQPFKMIEYGAPPRDDTPVSSPVGFELGHPRPGFGGTDTLPLNVQPKVLHWLYHTRPNVVAEGDRLANDKFFAQVVAWGLPLNVIALECPAPLLTERRALRGSQHDPAWLKGRETKVARLTKNWASHRLDATLPIDELAAQMRRFEEISTLLGKGA
jgi:hypothetical protein